MKNSTISKIRCKGASLTRSGSPLVILLAAICFPSLSFGQLSPSENSSEPVSEALNRRDREQAHFWHHPEQPDLAQSGTLQTSLSEGKA